jgi:hypothetical protein
MRQPPIAANLDRPTSRPHRRGGAAFGILALLLLGACGGTPPGAAEVAIVGLEATTYVHGPVTFVVAVVGGAPDSLELRRDGVLFQVLAGAEFTWATASAPEGSYVFVARARRGTRVIDSEPRTIVVDRTPATLTMSADPPVTPMVLPADDVLLTAVAADAHGVPRVEFLDGDVPIGTDDTAPFELAVPATRGLHDYRARVVDRAGNVTVTAGVEVPVYERQTVALGSEPALDGCIEAGYQPQLFVRRFDAPSCGYTTSYPILHLFSFDRSGLPGAIVEEATLRVHLVDAYDPSAYLASVAYAAADEAPPVGFAWPFVSDVPEALVPLATSGSGPSQERIDVTALVQADVAAGRPRTQFRLRSPNNGPYGLGGTVYFAEIADARAPTLLVTALVP